jgi:hypothetical protein
MRTAALAAAVCVAVCTSASAADPLPALKAETVATPVVTARMFNSGLAPNTRGGWTFVGEFMNFSHTGKPKHKVDLGNGRFYIAYDDTKARPEAEWVIADLKAGAYKIANWPGFHVPSGANGRVLAGNGRLFFSVDYAQIYYYDPAEDTVKPLGAVYDNIGELRIFYKFILGPDGMVYGSAQATNGLTMLIRLNPDTLEYKLYDKIGLPGRREGLTYGYDIAVDPPWMYVAVGQGNWELFAVNADTGEKKCLADVQGQGCRITVGRNKDYCTASVTGKDRRDQLYLVDGEALPGDAVTGLRRKTYPQVEWKNTKPMNITNPPVLDPDRPVEVGGKGEGEIFWRPLGDTAEWRQMRFAIKNAEPVKFESLLQLPDGSLLGNAEQYNGFFRYYPAEKKLDYFGKHGPSGVRSVIYEGKVWLDGYPNTNLSAYDPTQPWTSRTTNPEGAKVNPQFIGYFGQGCTEAHFCRFLLAPGNGRIYICGERERWSTGTGIGYYETATARKFGLGTANKDINPAGFLALPKLNRIVLSGKALEKGEMKLIVYDMDLNEISRIALRPGLASTGALYAVDSDSQFIGCYSDPDSKKSVLYLYDLAQTKILKSLELDLEPGVIFSRPEDGTHWVFVDDTLNTLDTKTLTLKPVATLQGGLKFPVWSGKDIFGARGGELLRVTMP